MTASQYWWLERRLFEVLGGWVPTVPEPEVKLVLRRHSFQHARHAELWAALLAVDAVPEKPPGGALSEALEGVAAATGTADRLATAYGVVLAQLVAVYRDLAAGLRRETDGPLLDALDSMLGDDVAALTEIGSVKARAL